MSAIHFGRDASFRRVRRIVSAVSAETGVSLDDIYGTSRINRTVVARQLAYMLAVEESIRSEDIATVMLRDRSTVSWGAVKMRSRANEDPVFAGFIGRIRQVLNPVTGHDGYAGAGARQRCIALDFDGVIHSYVRGWTGPKPEDQPMGGALEVIEYLIEEGFTVVIYTCRDARSVINWLYEHGFPQLEVTSYKPHALVYVDDRGYYFRGWPELLDDLAASESEERYGFSLQKTLSSSGGTR